MMRETEHYNRVATALHWLMAFAIAFMLGLGFYMHDLDETAAGRYQLYQLHKSIGITILALTAVRLIWRLTHRANFRALMMSSFERIVSKLVHAAFYFLMFALPMSGWVLSSSAPIEIQTVLFNTIPLPNLPVGEGQARIDIHEASGQAHEVLAIIACALLVLHMLAALKHHYINHDSVLVRMVPLFSRQWPGYFVIFFVGMLVLSWTMMTLDLLVSPDKAAPQDETVAVEQTSGLVSDLRGSEWPDTLVLNQDQGELLFFWYQPTQPQPGEFSQFRVNINLSQDNPAHRLLDVDIDMAEIAVEDINAEAMLLSTEWFDTDQYARAHFRSSQIEAEDSAWRVYGELTIRNRTKPIDFLLHTDTLEDGSLRIFGEFSLIRQEFDVGIGEWSSEETVASEVLVKFDLNYTAAQSVDQVDEEQAQ